MADDASKPKTETSTPTPTPTPWHAAYPEPGQKLPNKISRQQLLQKMKVGKKAGKDFLLVDLRRNDHEGGTIRGSLNLPAQSLYYTLPTLLETCQHAGIPKVIFYCGSSQGRGTRAAGWFDDLLKERRVTDIESMILEGGIKGWANAGEEFVDWMDEYDESVWTKYR